MQTIAEVHRRILGIGCAGKCTIYTDGGCEPNPGHGGWGVRMIFAGGAPIDMHGGDSETTNNRMEMTAALQGIRALPPGWAAEIVTDSQYLLKGMTDWMVNWKRRGWVTKQKQPVMNRDIWIALDGATRGKVLTWRWVRGHAGDEHNEAVDQLATIGRAAFLNGEVERVAIAVDLLEPAPAIPAARLL